MKSEVRYISDMQDGDTAWASPWTLSIDHDDNCWLDPTAIVSDQRTNTSNMQILRDAGEYHVWPPADYRWFRGRRPQLITMIPVAGVHEDGDQ